VTDGSARGRTLRASAIRAGRRAKVGDTLIAQCCLDNEIPLVTRDRDFRLFAKVGGLQLAVPA
jgi:predicted nucleic acid-binding protein